jgi:chromosome segregation ATPase
LHHINVKFKFSILNLSLTNYIICLLFHLINILFKKIKNFISLILLIITFCLKDQIVCLEKQVNERVEELSKIKNDLKKNESTVAEQAQTIQNILNERDALNGFIQKLTKEKNQLEANHENLSQELNFSRDKLLAAEESKEILKSQFAMISSELEDTKKTRNSGLDLIKELTDKVNQLESENNQLNEV